MKEEIWSTATLEEQLVQAGDKLPDDLRDFILAQGEAIVPALVEVLNNEPLQMEDAPGGGWAPIHAVDLLGQMQAVAAIPSMVMWIQEIDSLSYLHDRLLQALIAFGEEALQPVIAAYGETTLLEERQSLCSILSESAVKNDTIFDILLRQMKEDVEFGTICLTRYGDTRALPHFQQSLDKYEVSNNTENPIADQVVIELCGAIEDMGGRLTPSQQRKLDQVDAHRAMFRRRLNALSSGRDKTAKDRKKIGRNEPCWCGSGKKYKKCHLDADRAASN